LRRLQTVKFGISCHLCHQLVIGANIHTGGVVDELYHIYAKKAIYVNELRTIYQIVPSARGLHLLMRLHLRA
jgi:hypothetical protein